VHVDTALAMAESRDVKGLYAKARRGELKNFTGIDSPYEAPEHPEVYIDTSRRTAEESAVAIVDYLQQGGWLAPS
jgi:bifunctional enzyme CysN/CysC